MEPIEYDTSNSSRLLPTEYYKQFSDGKQVYVGKADVWTLWQAKRAPKVPRDSKTLEAIRKQVMSKELLGNMHYYANFRPTGVLESYNAPPLRYTPKLLYILLVRGAVDNNDGVHRPVVPQRNGHIKVGKVYSKKSNSWVPALEKVPKTYKHVPHLLARVLSEACSTPFRFGMHQRFAISVPNDPNTAKSQTSLEDVLRWCRFAPALLRSNPNEPADEEQVICNLEDEVVVEYGLEGGRDSDNECDYSEQL